LVRERPRPHQRDLPALLNVFAQTP
jgi:hypothetical protein